MPATLVARDLTFSRGRAVILDGVSLTVGPEARIGLVGPNGVGKSTLLRLLAGLETPDSGSITAMPPSATVGYLPQEPDRRPGEVLLDYLRRRTGVAGAEAALEATAEAMGDGGDETADAYSSALERYLSLGGPDFDARAAATWDDLGLDERLLSSTTEVLSGGEAARASLAVVLLSRFDVLLLDEPTNDLDFDGLERLERFVTGMCGAPFFLWLLNRYRREVGA